MKLHTFTENLIFVLFKQLANFSVYIKKIHTLIVRKNHFSTILKQAFLHFTSDLHLKTIINKNSLEVHASSKQAWPSRSRSRDLSNDMRIVQPSRSATFKTRRAQTARQRSSFFFKFITSRFIRHKTQLIGAPLRMLKTHARAFLARVLAWNKVVFFLLCERV